MQTDMEEYRLETTNLSNLTGCSIKTDGCILLFCTEGYGIVSANFERHALRKGYVCIVFPDTLLTVDRISRSFSTRLIETSPDLSDETTYSLSSHFFDRVYDTPIFPAASEEWRLASDWLRQTEWAAQQLNPKSARIFIRNTIHNFFTAMEALLLQNQPNRDIKSLDSTRHYFNRFCQLLVEHCYEQHDVRFYADKLCITPYYLSRITRRTFNLSPKEIIDRQIIIELKRMLSTTNLSAKEIADRFHFDTTSYMGRFFRRHTGMNPTEFRKQS